jgi:hypothetical protein
MEKKYVYKATDPMVKITERMLKNYFKASNQKNVFVKKWYCNNGTVEIWAEAA